ncbi:MAG: sigma-70 family RNA polymerase sigma factor [Planctomycetes bacterium]|nr:sigma-70 family RNA polymerase sigma factor [Planctomycetota bacterium]
MTQLTQPNSPLAQARKTQGVRMGRSRRRLSTADEAVLRQVLEGKYEYIPSEVFNQPRDEAERQIFDEAPDIQQPDTSWYHPVMDNLSPERTAKSNGQVLLTAKEERVLFRQFNYCRMRVCELKAQLKEQHEVDVDQARELLVWHRKAEMYRDQIARTNLALVLAMAKRTRLNEMDFADMISEGNMALLRAIDKFDVERGFKFSTYACRAILKAFSRAGVKFSKYRSMFPTDFDPKLERSDYMQTKRAEHEDDCVGELRDIIRSNRADLSNIEQEVITHRFALERDEEGREGKALTLEQVGRIIGVTKERVRQIQNKALDKIRVQLEGDFLA